jgi:hypothetical protein
MKEIDFDELETIYPRAIYERMYPDEYHQKQFPYEWWLQINWPQIKEYYGY